MPESAESASKSRCKRVRTCSWCASLLKDSARKDAKFCGGKCRYRAAMDRGHSGRVSSVRELKDGRVSVVIYMNETDLRPGQDVKVGVDRD